MSSLLNIGVSALRTQQSALAVIGQNVTNASTPGYSRQRVEMSALAGSAALPNSPGAGVTVSNISRVADELLEAQVRRDTSAHGGLETMSDWLQQLEVQLFDDQFGIDAAMGQMFAAFNNAASDPADIAAREFVLSSAAALVRRFNAFADHSIRQNRDVTAALASTTAEANELSAALVDVNAR
ncbi:MAG: flagellar basal body protein, partial [Pseudomonadota bacterium]